MSAAVFCRACKHWTAENHNHRFLRSRLDGAFYPRTRPHEKTTYLRISNFHSCSHRHSAERAEESFPPLCQSAQSATGNDQNPRTGAERKLGTSAQSRVLHLPCQHRSQQFHTVSNSSLEWMTPAKGKYSISSFRFIVPRDQFSFPFHKSVRPLAVIYQGSLAKTSLGLIPRREKDRHRFSGRALLCRTLRYLGPSQWRLVLGRLGEYDERRQRDRQYVGTQKNRIAQRVYIRVGQCAPSDERLSAGRNLPIGPYSISYVNDFVVFSW